MTTSSSPDGVSIGGRTVRALLRLLTLFHRIGSSVLGAGIWPGLGPASPHRARRSAFDILLLDRDSGADWGSLEREGTACTVAKLTQNVKVLNVRSGLQQAP